MGEKQNSVPGAKNYLIPKFNFGIFPFVTRHQGKGMTPTMGLGKIIISRHFLTCGKLDADVYNNDV